MLRVAVGVPALLHGTAWLWDSTSTSVEHRLIWICGAFAGSFLILGLLTPVASAMVAFGAVAIVAAWLPVPGSPVFNTAFDATLFVPLASAIALLGPGALSVDARLFGRREIIIPPR